jgi:hypothetical protein
LQFSKAEVQVVQARLPVLIVAAALAAAVGSVSAYASGDSHTLSITGEVQSPTTYTSAELSALPQTTVQPTVGGRQVTYTGVPLEALVIDRAQPAYPDLPNIKNKMLRVTATVRGNGHEVTFAVGELDAGFGNHPALLALIQDGHTIDGGPMLVVPGDRAPARFVPQVSEVVVGIATAPATSTNPAAGSPVAVHGGSRGSLSAALLGRLPAETLSVAFQGPGPQTHTEIGPPLIDVLALAGVAPTFDTWVAAVGSDNYAAVVTPGEQLVGGRSLQLSLNEDGVVLAQPRLVVGGDVKGGRYVSDVVDIYAGTGPAH